VVSAAKEIDVPEPPGGGAKPLPNCSSSGLGTGERKNLELPPEAY